MYLSQPLDPHAPEQSYSASCKEPLPQQATSQTCSHFSQSVLQEKKDKEKDNPVAERSNTWGQLEPYKQKLFRLGGNFWPLKSNTLKYLPCLYRHSLRDFNTRNSGFATFKFRCRPKKQLKLQFPRWSMRHQEVNTCASIQSTAYANGNGSFPITEWQKHRNSRRSKSIDSHTFCDFRCLPETLS